MKIAVVILSITTISFLISYLAVSKKLAVLTAGFAELIIVHESLKETLDSNMFDKSETDQDIHKENFIKFLSDSRNWAFEYIEDVQNGLKDFSNAIEKDIEHFDKYGEVGSSYPHYESMKRISQAYKELKTLLPMDTK